MQAFPWRAACMRGSSLETLLGSAFKFEPRYPQKHFVVGLYSHEFRKGKRRWSSPFCDVRGAFWGHWVPKSWACSDWPLNTLVQSGDGVDRESPWEARQPPFPFPRCLWNLPVRMPREYATHSFFYSQYKWFPWLEGLLDFVSEMGRSFEIKWTSHISVTMQQAMAELN